jgi:hypothetical protein
MQDKDTRDYIKLRLGHLYSRVLKRHKETVPPAPPPDLRRRGRGGKNWWLIYRCDLEQWFCDRLINAEDGRTYDLFRSRGITHIKRYGRPYNRLKDRDDQEYMENYNQYVNAAGEVIDEEEC